MMSTGTLLSRACGAGLLLFALSGFGTCDGNSADMATPKSSGPSGGSFAATYSDPPSRCMSPTTDPTTPNLPVATWTMSDSAVTSNHSSPYMTAAFVKSQNSYTFGQAPSWTLDGRVLADLSGDPTQIYNSQLDGRDQHCLTCGQPNDTANGQAAKNGLAQERPQGDWILFESTRGHVFTYGGDGFGGAGDAMWVMRPDGSCPVQLTGIGSAGEATNDFHAYFSPDGKKIIWTHISGNLQADSLNSGTEFTMRLADFVDDGVNPPHIENETIVGPRGENYETEPWAPDGSGFLFQYSDAGQNQQVYYMRLYGQGATPLSPQVQRITDGTPSWNEQALFTPDMSAVIFMSSRDCATCLYNVETSLSHLLGVPQLPVGLDGIVYIPLYFAAILPAALLPPGLLGFKTDLYITDLYTKGLRRLTNDNGVIPEFYWDHQGHTLLWSENHVYGNGSLPAQYTNNTMTAYFDGLP